MDIDKIHLYRLTHVDNVPHILENGVTHKSSPNANMNYKGIGDVSLIGTRNQKNIIVDNGQLFDVNAESISLGDFIPFYFGVRMPMLYVIQTGGNFVENATPPEEIIYMACRLNKIIDLKLKFYFSDGHATDNLTTFYDDTMASSIPDIINWGAVKASYWGGQDNLNTKRQKQAEFLVGNDLPVECIRGFACYNNSAKNKLESFGIEPSTIKVSPNAYY